MHTATEFHKLLTEAAAKAIQEIRDHRPMRMGAVGHQGDVYIHRIKSIPTAWNVLVTEHHQVALGASVGSRHVADGPAIQVYWPQSVELALEHCPVKGLVRKLGRGAGFCLGPIVHVEEDWTLTHPEHAHHLFPAGDYLTTYQLDFSRQRQVQD